MKVFIKLAPFILFVMFPLFGCFSDSYGDNALNLSVINGRADLRGIDLEKTERISLKGKWEFYWRKLLKPADFKRAENFNLKRYINVPGCWNDHEFDGVKIEPYGYATCRVVIRTNYRGELSLDPGFPQSAYRIWVNGRLLNETGVVGKNLKDGIPGKMTRYIDFTNRGEDIEIIIQVSNYSYFKWGLRDAFLLGKKENIRYSEKYHLAFDFFLLGIFIVIGLYHSAVYLIRKRELYPLWFGLFSFLIATRIIVTNNAVLVHLFPGINWELLMKIEFLTVSLSLPLFYEFISSLYKNYLIKSIKLFFQITGAAYSLIIIFFPVRFFSILLPWYHLVLLLGGLYILYLFLYMVYDKKEGALITFAGLIVLLVTMFNDVLVANDIVNGYLITHIGFLCFIFAQSMNLTADFSRSYRRVEELSENLEKKVMERTSELELEKNRYRLQHDLLERELLMAQKIQEQMVPFSDPSEKISVIYRPMKLVGGDFYDFLKFRNSDKIGIFLSDVSGHGVPAAFITSMVKTTILQSGPRRENPAELLSYLNEHLINQTSDNFVTAFYGIYDPENRSLIYANAGHVSPFLIRGGEVHRLEGVRSMPLAIMENDILLEKGKLYANNEVELEHDTRLLLYTDGFTETTASGNPNFYFEDEILEQAILELNDLSCKKFIEHLIARLIEFKGDDKFEDDVCLICMDV